MARLVQARPPVYVRRQQIGRRHSAGTSLGQLYGTFANMTGDVNARATYRGL